MMPLDDPIQRFLEHIAAQEGIDVRDLPPLYNTINPDALSRLLAASDAQPQIAFTYFGYRVIIDRTGEITVEPEEDE